MAVVSNEGDCIVSEVRPEGLWVWDMGRMKLMRAFKGPSPPPQASTTNSTKMMCRCVWLGGGGTSGGGDNHVFAGYDGGVIMVWQVGTARLLHSLHLPTTSSVLSIREEGDRLVVGGTDGIVYLLDIQEGQGEEGRLLQSYQGHEGDVNSVYLSGHYIASGGDDMVVRLWDRDNGELLRVLEGHEHIIYAVWLSSSSSGSTGRVVSASKDETIRIWELDTGGGSCQDHPGAYRLCHVGVHDEESHHLWRWG